MIPGLRGQIFEVIVRKLLEKNEYEDIPDDNQTIKDGKIRGRGAWHQIDAFGRFSYSIPFVYPIRLIAEAKWYEGNRDKVGLDTVRNFFGVLKDISENYFVENGHTINEKILLKRYTDCGAIFSVNGFSTYAQSYAYAQGIFLVSYENHPIIKKILDSTRPVLECINTERAYKNKKKFSIWFYSQLSNQSTIRKSDFVTNDDFFTHMVRLRNISESIKTSVIGIASGIYPIHLLSKQDFPEQMFRESDERYCRVHYYRGQENILKIKIRDIQDFELICSIPEQLILKYVSQMLKFKKKFFKYVDIPINLRGIRRIIRLKLDPEWVNSLERKVHGI